MNNKEIYDCLIIGAGPAGLTASIYAQRANLKSIILEKDTPGGKMSKTSTIENYPGFSSIKGYEISLNMLNQATSLGAKYLYGNVTSITKNDNLFKIECEDGKVYFSKATIIATGMKERKIGVPGEEEFYGNGVSYCAICDGALFKDKEVAIVGGGNSAVEESLYLAEMVNKVYLIHRSENFRAEEKIIEKVKNNKKIEIITNTEIKSINGNRNVENIIVFNNKTNEEKKIELSGVFIFIGFNPETKFIDPKLVEIKDNFIVTNNDMETNLKGLFSIGDVNNKKIRQISTAVSDGTIAALNVKKYLDEQNN